MKFIVVYIGLFALLVIIALTSCSDYSPPYAREFKLRDHQFLKVYYRGDACIIHDPDCPCRSKE
jgi:hypothetical protein